MNQRNIKLKEHEHLENPVYHMTINENGLFWREDQGVVGSDLIRSRVWLMELINHPAEARNRDRIFQGRSVEDNVCIWWFGPLWITQQAKKSFVNFIPVENLPAWTKGDWDGTKWKKGFIIF